MARHVVQTGAMLATCLAVSVAVLVAESGVAWAAAKPLVPPQPEADEFHFVVLGDAQFHNPALFNRVVDQARRLHPAFVIQVGDLIDGYHSDLDRIEQEWQRFERQIAPLAPVPFLPVPGNHDIYGGDKQPDAALERVYETRWGPLFYSFAYKNALFITLNSDSTEGINQIGPRQLAWLQKTLADTSAEHRFVFLHRPPLLMDNAEALHQLFAAGGVSHVFYGHHHHYHFIERDGIQYTMTNAAAISAHDEPLVGGFHHLLQVSVRGAEVGVAVIEADAIKSQDAVFPRDNYDLFALTRDLAPEQVPVEVGAEGTYRFEIPLHNGSSRSVQLFVSCRSADDRWEIEPRRIEPLTLAPGTSSTLALRATYQPGRVPESDPECHIRLPLQVQSGQWFDYARTVTGRILD